MPEFPDNPEDVSSQMGPPLAEKLNDDGVVPGSPPSDSHMGLYMLKSRMDRMARMRMPMGTEPGPEHGISTAGDEWGLQGPYVEVPLGEFGIDNIEVTRNPDVADKFGLKAWSIAVSGPAGRAVWDEFAPEWLDGSDV